MMVNIHQIGVRVSLLNRLIYSQKYDFNGTLRNSGWKQATTFKCFWNIIIFFLMPIAC